MSWKTLVTLIMGILIGLAIPNAYSYLNNATATPTAPIELNANNTNITCVPLDPESNIYKVTVSSNATQFEEPPNTRFHVRWGPGNFTASHKTHRMWNIGGSSNTFDIEANFTGLSGEIPIILSKVPYIEMGEHTVRLGNETIIKEIRYRIP